MPSIHKKEETVKTPHERSTGRNLLRRPGRLAIVLFFLTILHPYHAARTENNPGLDLKIGQMLIAGFRGRTARETDGIVQEIRERHLGGVILFDYDVALKKDKRNIASPEQVRKLIAALQSFASIPLFVAIDYEGGKIERLKEDYGFPPTVSHEELGRINDPALTYRRASAMASTLAELGFNLNLAPVVDLRTNPGNPVIAQLERSFSPDPAVVTRHALEFIRAHNERGILTSLKHFPGHGSSDSDSHLGMADVTKTWTKKELEPFREIIRAGRADTVMTAHVFNAGLDENFPATLSERTVDGLLRRKLGFGGVVISDDLGMNAIAGHYGFETAILKTIEAGADILLLGNNGPEYRSGIAGEAIAVIKRLVRDGRISESRIDESYRRIQKLKSKLPKRKK